MRKYHGFSFPSFFFLLLPFPPFLLGMVGVACGSGSAYREARSFPLSLSSSFLSLLSFPDGNREDGGEVAGI